MKWAKLANEIKREDFTSQEIERCFTVYQGEEQPSKTGKIKARIAQAKALVLVKEATKGARAKVAEKEEFGLWNTHDFEFSFKAKGSYESFQKRYETFIGGFLFFYDTEVRNNGIDHKIYFKWKKNDDKKNSYHVDIYISPKPLTQVKNKSTPSDGDTDPPKPPPPPPPTMNG